MEKQKNHSNNSIKNELSRLQKVCGSDKACLFNLIVYTQEQARTEYFKGIADLIKKQFPCRIIFIQGKPSSKENILTLKVTSEKSTEEKGIICDQIWIEASGQEMNKVYFLLLPLFVSDLPIYLLWGQDPTKENSILPHLERFATRLIFDSEATDDLQQFSREILKRIQSTHVQIVDMNWARIGGWIEVLGQVFDSPERFDQLSKAESIQIFYNDKPSELLFHPQTQAIYLQAWLSSCLEWQFKNAEKKGKNQIINYSNKNISSKIELVPKTDQNFESEEILEVFVKGTDYESHLKKIAKDHLQVKNSNQFECKLPFTLMMSTLESGRSFMQEIFYHKISSHYVDAMKLISRANWS